MESVNPGEDAPAGLEGFSSEYITSEPSLRIYAAIVGQTLAKLPKWANRVVRIKNLPFNMSAEQLYQLCGKFGSIRQLRRGMQGPERGTVYVVYDNILNAKKAVDSLAGYNVSGRYLDVIFFNPNRKKQIEEARVEQEAVLRMRAANEAALEERERDKQEAARQDKLLAREAAKETSYLKKKIDPLHPF